MAWQIERQPSTFTIRQAMCAAGSCNPTSTFSPDFKATHMPNAPRFRLKQLAGICRRVGISLEAGVDARKAWSREADRVTGKRRFTIESIVDELGKGTSISDAIKKTGNAFPQLMHDLVRIGDQTGNNDQVFLRLADHLEHMENLRSTFLRGLIWPGIQLLFAIPVVAIMIYISEGISEALELEVDLLGLGLQGKHGVTTFFVLAATAIMVAAFLIENWRHGRLGGKQIQGLLYKVPVLGKCLELSLIHI